VRPIGTGLRGRVGQYVAVADPGKTNPKESATLLSSRLYAGAERSLDKAGFWTRFKEDIELAEMDVDPMHLALLSVLGALVAGWLLAVITGIPLVGLAGLLVLLIPRAIVHRAVRKRRTAFAEQLPDNLQVMASAMRAGHSLVGAMAVVVEDSSEPSAGEF